MTRRFVQGRIIISGDVQPFSGATANITLEDVSYMDRESGLIAETVLKGVAHTGGETIIPFHLDFDYSIDERNDYAVGVWIDIDGSGRASEKDLYSRENYLVLTRGFGNSVEIKVS